MADFNFIKAGYRSNPIPILEGLVGQGKIEGDDYVALNPRRPDNKLGSFKIEIKTGKYNDFAPPYDHGGSIIDLTAFVFNCGIAEAADKLVALFPSLASNTKSSNNQLSLAKKKKVDPLYIWSKSLGYLKHPYLDRKHITVGNARVHLYKGIKRIVVPLTDTIPTWARDLNIRGIQFIYEDGRKGFPQSFKGLFHIASDYECSKEIIVVAEGYATARSIAESTGLYVIAAMSACNIKTVVAELLKYFKDSKIIIAADNDEAGRRAAEDTKQLPECDISAVYPTQGCNDFNDLFVEHGAQAIQAIFDKFKEGNDGKLE